MSDAKTLIQSISEIAGITKAQAKLALDGLAAEVRMAAGRGEAVRIPGLGTITPITRPARAGRHPGTGEAIQIAEKRDVKFKPLAEFRAAL